MPTLRLLSSTAVLAALALSGCARARCEQAADKCTGTSSLTVDGRERTFVVHTPPAEVRPAGGMPLVIGLHGNLGDGEAQQKLTHFDAVADARGYLTVYPDGIEKSWADGRGGTEASKAGVDDVKFIGALIDHFVATAAVDPKRVYVHGFSNGAIMSHSLACELSDRIVAVAALGAAMPENVSKACAPKRPVPMIVMMGTEDPFIPFDGGTVKSEAGGLLLSAAATRDRWLALNGCATALRHTDEPDVDPDDGTRLRRSEAESCATNRRVVLYTVEGGGHTWPGGYQYLGERLIGRTSKDLDATEVIADFFDASGALP